MRSHNSAARTLNTAIHINTACMLAANTVPKGYYKPALTYIKPASLHVSPADIPRDSLMQNCDTLYAKITRQVCQKPYCEHGMLYTKPAVGVHIHQSSSQAISSAQKFPSLFVAAHQQKDRKPDIEFFVF